MDDKFHFMVAAAEISRTFGEYQKRALLAPIIITHHGKPLLVLTSVEAFERQTVAHETGDRGEATTARRLRLALDHVREGFLAFDDRLNVVQCNMASEMYLGKKEAELEGRDLREVVPSTSNSIIWPYLERVKKSGEPEEARIHSFARARSNLLVKIFPYEGGGVGLIYSNVSLREELTAEQSRSEAAAAVLGAERHIALIRLNARGAIETVDDAFCQISGYSREALKDLLLVEILHVASRVPFGKSLNAAVRDGKLRTLSVILSAHDGEQRRLRLNIKGRLSESPADEVFVCAVDLRAITPGDS